MCMSCALNRLHLCETDFHFVFCMNINFLWASTVGKSPPPKACQLCTVREYQAPALAVQKLTFFSIFFSLLLGRQHQRYVSCHLSSDLSSQR